VIYVLNPLWIYGYDAPLYERGIETPYEALEEEIGRQNLPPERPVEFESEDEAAAFIHILLYGYPAAQPVPGEDPARP